MKLSVFHTLSTHLLSPFPTNLLPLTITLLLAAVLATLSPPLDIETDVEKLWGNSLNKRPYFLEEWTAYKALIDPNPEPEEDDGVPDYPYCEDVYGCEGVEDVVKYRSNQIVLHLDVEEGEREGGLLEHTL